MRKIIFILCFLLCLSTALSASKLKFRVGNLFTIAKCYTVNVKIPNSICIKRSKSFQRIIPLKVTHYVKNNFPGWQFPSSDLWDKKTFNDYKSDHGLAYYATGDFNGDQKADYVILLVNNKKQYATWVLISTDNNFKKARLQFNSYSDKVDFALAVLKPGFYNYHVSDNPNPDPIKTKYDSIKIVYSNGEIGVNYWKDGKFDSFMMEDIKL